MIKILFFILMAYAVFKLYKYFGRPNRPLPKSVPEQHEKKFAEADIEDAVFRDIDHSKMDK